MFSGLDRLWAPRGPSTCSINTPKLCIFVPGRVAPHSRQNLAKILNFLKPKLHRLLSSSHRNQPLHQLTKLRQVVFGNFEQFLVAPPMKISYSLSSISKIFLSRCIRTMERAFQKWTKGCGTFSCLDEISLLILPQLNWAEMFERHHLFLACYLDLYLSGTPWPRQHIQETRFLCLWLDPGAWQCLREPNSRLLSAEIAEILPNWQGPQLGNQFVHVQNSKWAYPRQTEGCQSP